MRCVVLLQKQNFKKVDALSSHGVAAMERNSNSNNRPKVIKSKTENTSSSQLATFQHLSLPFQDSLRQTHANSVAMKFYPVIVFLLALCGKIVLSYFRRLFAPLLS